MTEEERLELVSTVEDDFSEDLEKLEQDLESIDHQITETGHGIEEVEINVSTTGVAETMAELEALERQLDDLDDEINASVFGDNSSDDGLFSDFNPAAQSAAEDFIGPYQFQRDDTDGSVSMGGGTSDGGAVTSGGVRDFTLGSNEDLRDVWGVTVPDIDEAMDMPGPMGDDDSLDLSFRRLKEEVIDLQFTMGTFHDLFASVLPLVGVFAGALPAAIGGVAALGAAALGAAGVLAGIGALGAMGMSLEQTGEVSMEPIAEQLSQLSSAFVDAFAPLAQSLAPTVEQAFETIEQMFGPLATASQGLLAFRDEFTALVEGIAGALPGVVRNVLAFTDAIMPTLQGVINFVAEQDILGALAQTLSKAAPELQNMGEALVQIVPAVLTLSQGFLVMASAIVEIIGVAAAFFNVLGPLGQAIGFVIGALLTVIAATSLWSTAIAALSGTIIVDAVAAFASYTVGVIVSMHATFGLATAILTLISIVTLGVGAVAGLAGAFSLLSGEIGGARKELENFANTQSSMRGMGGDLGGSGLGGSGGPNVYNDQSTTVIYADNRDDAARQQYSSEFERRQHRDSVFGG